MQESSLDQPSERAVRVSVDSAVLEGIFAVPPAAQGVVLFAHGSGSGRHSPRNQFVARALQEEGLATLLLDLLTPEEEVVDLRTREFRFNIPLLADRLVGATDWLSGQPDAQELNVGYFGASTGAAAALIAASERPHLVEAVVSRGGRADLAAPILPDVKAPTLLIVGGNDLHVIDLNRQAMSQLQTEKKLEIVPGAGHLFQEPGTLEQVALLAGEWFRRHLISSE